MKIKLKNIGVAFVYLLVIMWTSSTIKWHFVMTC